jgi:hypothetical protein
VVISHSQREFSYNMARAWLPTYNGTLFSYWRHHEIPRRSCLAGRRQSHGQMVFTDAGVRLTKLPSTTFGTYQPPLANTNDVSKATRSDLGVSFWRPIGLRPGALWGFSFSHIALHRLHRQVTICTSKYIFIIYVFYFSFVNSFVLTFSAPAMCS